MFGSFVAGPDGRRVHSRSFGSFVCAQGVVEFILVRFVHSGAPRGRRGHSRSFGRTPGVVEFIRGRYVLSGAPSGSSGSF